MRCVVTGAGGFIGSNLCDALLEAGHQVIGIDCFIDYYPRSIKELNLVRAKSFKNFHFIEANLLELDLSKLCQETEFIFHQAAQAGVRASWGESFEIYTSNNILATQKLLEAAKNMSNLKKIVYASTSSIYGDAETYPTAETILPGPISPYTVSKLAGEHLMGLYRVEFGVPTISLRYFTVYGPRQRPDMGFHRFIKAALQGEKIIIFGDGEQTRDFTFVSDIVKSNLLAAAAETKKQVFNIGGGSRVSVNQVIKTIETILGKKLLVEYQPRALGDVKHTAADITLAQKELGYQPEVDLEVGLKREISWLEEVLA